jgi:proliferating cell nuclear antigen PCNA
MVPPHDVPLANTNLVSIECSKDQVKFTCAGDIGSGSVILKPTENLDKPGDNVTIEMTEPVALTFSLKYLTNFCKASGLSDSVKLCLSSEVPLLVEYTLQDNSYLRFYLAPKVRSYHVPYSSISNLCRSATKSKWVMTSITRAACF